MFRVRRMNNISSLWWWSGGPNEISRVVNYRCSMIGDGDHESEVSLTGSDVITSKIASYSPFYNGWTGYDRICLSEISPNRIGAVG